MKCCSRKRNAVLSLETLVSSSIQDDRVYIFYTNEVDLMLSLLVTLCAVSILKRGDSYVPLGPAAVRKSKSAPSSA